MFSYSIMDVTIRAVIDRRRKKQNNLYPTKIEIQSHRKQYYIPTGVDLVEWPDDSEENYRKIKTVFEAVRRVIDSMIASGHQAINVSEIKQRIVKCSGSDVNAFLVERMRRCRDEGRVNSYYRIRNALRAIEEYTGGTTLPLERITPKFLEGLECFWRDHRKGNTTINIYMRAIKCAMRDAAEAGMMDISMLPFGARKYEAPQPKRRKTALNSQQVLQIIAFSGSKSLELYRDLWLFSYLCNGINFRDMLFLRYSNIEGNEITFIRSKTRNNVGDSVRIRAYITPKMWDIIRTRGRKSNKLGDNFIFPYARENMSPFEISNLVRRMTTLTNRALKQISAAIGIPPFTTYSARHTFATILNRQGIDITYISECLGHTSISTTEVYLSGFEPEDRKKYSELLTEFGRKKK